MNVLFVDQFSSIGGGQLCLLDVLQAAKQRGWDGTVAAPGAGPLFDSASALGFDVVNLPGEIRDLKAWEAARYIRRQTDVLSKVINEGDFDLVYANGPRILAAVQPARQHVPLIFHAHNRPRRQIGRMLAGYAIYSSAATVIACCRFVADVYRSYATQRSVHVIENGVPDMGFRERRFCGTLRVGVIGRLEPEKGQLIFARAARMVKAAGVDCEFVVCGSDSASNLDYANQIRAAAMGLPFEFLPWQTGIEAVLKSMDLLAVPSLNEGMPRVVLEAFSAGVPVVAFPTGGIPEVIDDGTTGFLVADTSAAGLATHIIRLLQHDRAALPRVAAAARRQWTERHQVATYQTAVAEVMARCVAERVQPAERAARPHRRV